MKIRQLWEKWFMRDLRESGKPRSNYTEIEKSSRIVSTKGDIQLRRAFEGYLSLWVKHPSGRTEIVILHSEDLQNLRDIINEFLENVEYVEKGE